MQRGCEAGGLEVQREVVPARDVDEAVAEADEQAGGVGAIADVLEWEDGVLREFGFTEDEEGAQECSEDDEAEYQRRSPRFNAAAEVETEQEHGAETDHAETSEPVYCLEALQRAGAVVVDV